MLGQRRLIPSTSMLLAFEASARNGSFTEAAQELNLTQGAISRQVNALENQLGILLFRRIKKTIELTDTGKIYAKEIADSLRSIRNASLNAMSDTQGQTLNLAILPTFGMRWLMPRFPDFLKKNPQITVNFSSKLTQFDFDNENLHSAIHFGTDNWPNADATYLMSEQAVPVAAPSLVGADDINIPADLNSLPLLHLETRPTSWPDWFEQHQLEASTNKGMVLEQFAMVTQAAVAGLGVAMLPHFLIQTELERGELQVLINEPLRNNAGYYLVTPKAHTSYSPVVALRKWLKEQTA
ncbi:MAG: LysR family transcriptional regulator [Kordiimonadaceae bacterium]|jgi:LysR family transcriptional regulator, glycine cleavage system transcriptional activator|nr:LysR family transcriptional regulator [Kordiimonadaceae bacterium]MBT6031464.1 LysR family transcriptional regulator [Kordiimonadaceae bacterium]